MSSPATALPADTLLTTDRRAFLATLAAAGVMTGAPAALANTVDGADHPDAKLLELVAALFAAEAQWAILDARADAQDIFARCEALMPPVPPALFFQEDRDTWEVCYDPKRLAVTEIDGVKRRHYAEERHVPRLRWLIGIWRREGTGRNVVDRAEEIIAALDPYMAAVQQAEDLSGTTAFHEESSRNQELIDKLNFEIATEPARTAEGLAAKARAAAEAWGSPSYVVSNMLPELLRNEGIFRDFTFRKPMTLAISVLADAMKLAQPSSDRSAA